MTGKTFTRPEVYDTTVQWRQYHCTNHGSSFDKRILTLDPLEIYFPKDNRDIIINGDLSIGEYCFSNSIITVAGNVRCYQHSFVSQISTEKSFFAPQGNVKLLFVETTGNIHIGHRSVVGIAKSTNGNVTIGRNSSVEMIIANNVIIYKGTTVTRIYAKDIVYVPYGFPEENIIDCKGIKYL